MWSRGATAFYELEARVAGAEEFTLGAIDHATFNEGGQVVRFAVFTK